MSAIIGPETAGIYDDLVNGTCELGQSYGTVISGSYEEPEEIEEILGCNGNVSAVLLRDDKSKYTFTALFPSTTAKPARGDNVAFPAVAGAGLSGQITSVKVDWTQKGQRQMTITAMRWTAIGSAPTVTTIA